MHFRDEPPEVSVTLENIKSCISCGGESAPGPDGVKYSHMNILGEKKVSYIKDILNHSLQEGDIQIDWLDSHLTSVPKPEKDPRKIGSYYVITLQNTIGKLLEKILAKKLAYGLDQQKLLLATLGIYRRGKNTWTNAAVLASDVYDVF